MENSDGSQESKEGKESKERTKSRSTGATRTKAGFVSTATDDADIPDYVVVELRYEATVAFSAKRFAAPAAAEPQADSLNEVLSKFDIKSMRSQFDLPADAIRSRVEVAAVRAPAVAVCEAGNGYRFHPERFCAGGAEVGRGREEDRHGAETPESGVGRLCGAASRAGDAGRIGCREPQLRTFARLSLRRAGRNRR